MESLALLPLELFLVILGWMFGMREAAPRGQQSWSQQEGPAWVEREDGEKLACWCLRGSTVSPMYEPHA